MAVILQKGLIYLLMLAALASVVLGTRLLAADLSAFQVSSFLADWSEKGGEPAENAWEVAYQAANRALLLSPVDTAGHYDRLGLVYQWREGHSLIGDPKAVPSREAALAAYRRAAELRPLWPHAWVRIAQVKLWLSEFDDEFDAALHQAVTLGPWRVTVLEPVALLGVLAWHELNGEQRELVLEAARRAAGQPAAGNRIMARARHHHLSAELCAVFDPEQAVYRRHCRGV